MKYIFLIFTLLVFSGCFNKHGISAKYYSDCEEYYDLQGYYHKECGADDMITYKELGEKSKEVVDSVIMGKTPPKEDPSMGKVW
jgi:hypothetical protein